MQLISTDNTKFNYKPFVLSKNYNNLNQESDNNICFEEIYFYGTVNNNLKYNIISNILTNNDKIPITRERIVNFLNNYENSKK